MRNSIGREIVRELAITSRMRPKPHASEPEMRAFLARFIPRGWLHGTRDDKLEQEAVDLGLRRRWLRRELSEVHFTPKGRRALEALT